MERLRGFVGHGRRRPLLAVASIGAVTMAATIGIATTSAGDPPQSAATSGNTGSGASAAGVTPLLNMFEFGDTLGLPLACSDAGSVISIIGAETGSSKGISPLVQQLDGQCNQLSAKGSDYLQQAIAESRGLVLINPVVNPLIAGLAGGLTTTGTQEGPALAPFGPTVAGLGGTVAFFEGT